MHAREDATCSRASLRYTSSPKLWTLIQVLVNIQKEIEPAEHVTFKTRLWSPVKRDVQNRFKSQGFSGSRLTMSCRLHFVEDEKCLSLGTSFHHRGKGPNCQPIYKLSRTWTITLHGVKSHNVWYIELLPLWCPGILLSAAHSLYCSIFLLFHRKH